MFVRQKIRSVAILKCLGATTGQVLATYVAQVGAAGARRQSARRRARRRPRLRAIPASLSATFGGIAYGLTWSAVVQGLAVGLLVSLLFALVPLLEVRRVKPLLLLAAEPAGRRAATAGALARHSGARSIGAGRLPRSRWRPRSSPSRPGRRRRCGPARSCPSALPRSRSCCTPPAWLLVRGGAAARPRALVSAAPRRHRPRPAGQPDARDPARRSVSAASSCSACGRCSRTSSPKRSIDVRQGMRRIMFLIDIQQDQADGLREIVARYAGRGHRRRARPDAAGPGHRRPRHATSTSRTTRTCAAAARWRASTRSPTARRSSRTRRSSTASSGRQSPVPPTAPSSEVSIEQSIHERFRINVGDLMRFDVVGTGARSARHERAARRLGGCAQRRLHVRVPARRARAGAAHVTSAFVRGPDEAAGRGAAAARPRVAAIRTSSAIDARDVLARIRTVVDNIVLAISIVGGIALASGVLILIGAVAMTKFQRVYEAAILRTLGASTRLLGTMLASSTRRSACSPG